MWCGKKGMDRQLVMHRRQVLSGRDAVNELRLGGHSKQNSRDTGTVYLERQSIQLKTILSRRFLT